MIRSSSHLDAKQQDLLLKLFCGDMKATAAAEVAGVNRKTVNRWYRYLRDAIYMASRRAPRFEGEVEIDQSVFGGRRKRRDAALVRKLAGLTTSQILAWKQKHNSMPKAHTKVKVLGILRRGGTVYLHTIEREDEQTIMPIIRLVVEMGATIYTDEHGAFNKLRFDGYRHETINHSRLFAKTGGRHTAGIDQFWAFAKTRLANFKGIPHHMLPLHIKECEFRYNNKQMIPAMRALLATHQDPFPRHHQADKNTSLHRPRIRLKTPPSPIRRTSRTGSGPASAPLRPRARRKVRVLARKKVRVSS